MAEQPRLTKDLQEVLKEMSKAPGGNVAQPRPVTPGPILGGPVESKPGIVDPATGVRTRRDPAIELFRFYAYGEEKPSRIPAPAPDVKTVTVTEEGLTPREKAEREALKQAGRKVKETAERKAIKQGVREGTIGGMTRAPGSKPPITFTSSLDAAIQAVAERARRRADVEIIRDALHKVFGAPGANKDFIPELSRTEMLSREEQKYLDYLQRRIQDAIEAREAAMKEELARRGQTTPTLDEVRAMQEAERRTLEGRQAAEQARISRQKTEQSLVDRSKPPVTPRAPMGAIPPIMPGGGLLDMTK